MRIQVPLCEPAFQHAVRFWVKDWFAQDARPVCWSASPQGMLSHSRQQMHHRAMNTRLQVREHYVAHNIKLALFLEPLSQENAETGSKEKALNGADNLVLDAEYEPQLSVEYFDVQLMRLNQPQQQTPVAVWASHLLSPKSSESISSCLSVNQDHIIATSMPQNLCITRSDNRYEEYGVSLEALSQDCQLEILSPPEAIQCSFFDPTTDPRFKVRCCKMGFNRIPYLSFPFVKIWLKVPPLPCILPFYLQLRQLPFGGQAWFFTSSNSKKYWLQQCRQGIGYANSHLVFLSNSTPGNRFGPFIPVDPECPLVEKIIFNSAVLGDSIVLGAKRWLSLVADDLYLYNQARHCSILSTGEEQQELQAFSSLPLKGNFRRFANEYSSFNWQPLSFATSTAELSSLFLACVWVEASFNVPFCDWETKEDLFTWMLKHNVLGDDDGDSREVFEWALGVSNQLSSH